jgi:cytidylate kinase
MSLSKEQLVDRQVTEWMTRQRLRRAAQAAQATPPTASRVITVTGEYGSLGDTVANEVAQQLGFPVYDRQVIEMISQKAHVDATVVEEMEHHDRSYLQSLFDDVVHAEALEPASYCRRLHEVVGLIAAQGSSVILGRGANVILGAKRSLRVRCVAPPELRVTRIAEHLGVDPHKAMRISAEEDERRVRWVRSTVGGDIRDPTRYDLVLNTAFMSSAQCAAAVVGAFKA